MAAGADLFDTVRRSEARREHKFRIVRLDNDPVEASRTGVEIRGAAIARAVEIGVRAVFAIEHVVARTTGDRVIAVAALDRVRAAFAENCIVARRSRYEV